ncbi:TetR/AcrR family transcriptional regulator [Oleisolibacter albus]|uniref:TetR/AcrR family transcriptional regulator n=1 Tax=Oleisolibacter albus TaxID=2171757 RepID=UPI0013901821|nr:TetR/AcrR family transcriptional regulator [Oleisolibacter albus]
MPPSVSIDDPARPAEAATPRAAAMRQRLMQAGAELLGEVGVERISTNMVAARAGVSPPIFYRHFKHKYDLLAALGEALMERQNLILHDWLEGAESFEALMAGHYRFLLASIEVTAAMSNAVWIMRALRAVPALAVVRLASHEEGTGRITAVMRRLLPEADPAELRLRARIAVEAGYSVIEMALEDPGHDAPALCRSLTDIWSGGLLQGVRSHP